MSDSKKINKVEHFKETHPDEVFDSTNSRVGKQGEKIMENARLTAERINEALELLNDAAREKKEELNRIIGEKYSNIKGTFFEAVGRNKTSIHQIRQQAEGALKEGQQKVEETFSDLDVKVHENPWPYVGGAAVGALLLGFVLGSRR